MHRFSHNIWVPVPQLLGSTCWSWVWICCMPLLHKIPPQKFEIPQTRLVGLVKGKLNWHDQRFIRIALVDIGNVRFSFSVCWFCLVFDFIGQNHISQMQCHILLLLTQMVHLLLSFWLVLVHYHHSRFPCPQPKVHKNNTRVLLVCQKCTKLLSFISIV